MKIKRLVSFIIFVLCAYFISSCRSDDREENGVSYTESEIAELITGKWDISGYVKISVAGQVINSDYTGTIEFTKNQKYKVTSSAIYDDTGEKLYLSNLIGSNEYYTVLRKNGKTYLSFNHFPNNFLIESLNKTSFRLVEDETIQYDKYYIHFYITMISK